MSGPRVPGAGRHVKMSGVSVIITCQDETNVPGAGGSELTSEEYDQLVKMTKFTEFEIVTLWNHFKADFPCGNINQSQLSQMIKKTFPKYTCHHKSSLNMISIFVERCCFYVLFCEDYI